MHLTPYTPPYVSWILFTAYMLILFFLKVLNILFLTVSFSGKFREFDYGPRKNMERYGQSEPPNYNLKNLTAPTSLYYGTGDLLISPEVS
jgi:hypothetical protein